MDTAKLPSYTPSSARISSSGPSNSSFFSTSLPDVTPSVPPTPGNPQPYEPGWDPLAHGRPELPIAYTTAITSLTCTLGALTVTPGLDTFRYTERAKGSATGSMTLRAVSGMPDVDSVPLGSTWVLTVGYGASQRTFTGFLLGVKKNTDREGVSWELELGGSLALLESRTGTRAPLYCGPKPTTGGQAARIAARATHLEQYPWPDGTTLIDPPQSLDGQNLSGYLNELYEPAGRWVRDLGTTLRIEPPGGAGSGYALTQVLQITPYNGSARAWRSFRVRADYTQSLGYPYKTKVTTEISPSTQIKPWDQGGKTETRVTQTYLGSGVISENKVITGYYYATPFTEPAGGGDPCADLPPAPTRSLTWGPVSQEKLTRRYISHSSGALIVVGETITKSSKPTTVVEGVTSSPNTSLERVDRDYVISFLAWPGVCPQNQEAYVSRFTERIYTPYLAEGATGSPQFMLTSNRLTETYPVGTLPSGDTWETTELSWFTRSQEGGLNDAGRWVNQQSIYTDEPGPSVEWIRPETRSISLGASVPGTGIDDSEADTIPYAFTRDQLLVAGRLRWLQEEGVARGLAVGVPSVLAPPANATVSYNGVTYWVDAVNTEISVEGAVSTVELGLLG